MKIRRHNRCNRYCKNKRHRQNLLCFPFTLSFFVGLFCSQRPLPHPPSQPTPPDLRTFKNECHCTPNHQQPTVGPHPSRFTIRQTSQSTANNCVYCCVHRQCTSHGSVSLGTHVLQLQPNIHIFRHSNRMSLHAGQHQRPPHLGPPRNIHHHRIKRPLP